MKKIKGHVATNKVGSDTSFEFEVDDDTTEEEIQEMVVDVIWECLDYTWGVVENDN